MTIHQAVTALAQHTLTHTSPLPESVTYRDLRAAGYALLERRPVGAIWQAAETAHADGHGMKGRTR